MLICRIHLSAISLRAIVSRINTSLIRSDNDLEDSRYSSKVTIFFIHNRWFRQTGSRTAYFISSVLPTTPDDTELGS
ncbi:hypothetical protein HanXRQr2_Chr06g0272021 [Helianthus annuus]|uniref:Uncharacterized protein n=1 Tax=Helianthus annuus TaxID=4232 RepID=A0A9K3IUT1_HELAN|nr:hypothetical protein HanXRQr2_Chr06g0272021 [Helianthus annuus]KAJ0916520.1 hypothetical protein HanPSC8_Chr06g0262591 [Helianthus annuus]